MSGTEILKATALQQAQLIRDGKITLAGKPGLGTALREEVLRRPDVHIEFSDENHRINMSKG